jgi:molybdopterin-binding protein
VRRNLELGLRLRGVPGSERRGRAESTAIALGLESLLDADARTLSGGEAQRVALGRALALEPDVLFLDEPTANLDAEVRSRLREDLDRVARSRARAIVLATHDRSEAFFLADRIVVLREGREVQTGSPGALFENPSDPFIANVTGAELALRGTVEHVEGTLVGVRVAGMLLAAVSASGPLPPGASVKLAYRPEDLFLAREEPAGVSARNRFRATIRDVRSLGGLVRVRLRGPGEMGAIVTRAAAEELELRADAEIFVQIKATALHAFALAPEEKTSNPSPSPRESGERS